MSNAQSSDVLGASLIAALGIGHLYVKDLTLRLRGGQPAEVTATILAREGDVNPQLVEEVKRFHLVPAPAAEDAAEGTAG